MLLSTPYTVHYLPVRLKRKRIRTGTDKLTHQHLRNFLYHQTDFHKHLSVQLPRSRLCLRKNARIWYQHLLTPLRKYLDHPGVLEESCNNPIVERICNGQQQSSLAYVSLVLSHQQVWEYYLFR